MTFIVASHVWDTATTTGTGNFTVSGTAVSGHRTLSAVCATSDTFPYSIRNQAANEFEVGIGTYNGSNVFARTRVLSSSSSNALVNFSAGTKDVILTVPARNAYSREVIQDHRTYYVRTDGNDSNDGLTNSSGGAFLTIGRAMAVCSQIDFNGFSVAVQLAGPTPATFAETVTFPVVVGCANFSNFLLLGDQTTPSNFVVGAASGFTGAVNFPVGTGGIVGGIKINNTDVNGYGLLCTGGYCYFQNVEFAAALRHMVCEGGTIQSFNNYTVTGDAVFHMHAAGQAKINVAFATAALGTRNITVFAVAGQGGYVLSQSMTFTGTVTGQRYQATTNGVIETFGAGATYFPGTSAGTTSTGGQYD